MSPAPGGVIPGAGVTAARPALDVFLLAGQFPGHSQSEALADCVAYALAAEQGGFDAVWLAEHHFIRYGVCASAPTLAAYLLGRTTSLSIGTAAAILSNRHPVALAEEALLLDAVSGGRFQLGVARGGPWVDLEVFGTGLDRFSAGFAESLDVLTSALSGQVSATGEFFRFREVPLGLSSPQPVWVAATSVETVELAAVRGLPLLLGVHDDDLAKAALIERYRAAGGPLDAPHASAHLTYVAPSRAEATTALRRAMPGWLATTADYIRLVPGPERDRESYLEHLLRISPIGTLDDCAARLRQAAEIPGVSRLLLMVEGAGSRTSTLANIEALGALTSTRLYPRVTVA